MLKINSLDVKDVGHTVAIAGVLLWNDEKKQTHTLLYPSRLNEVVENHEYIRPSLEQWEEILRQFDLVETEIFAEDDEGKTIKKIVRKCQRSIEGSIKWEVYQRDNYSCRYCGKTGLPLTVDHVDLWENGGASIVENLITACKKCNRTRGNTPYPEWLQSDDYAFASSNLTEEEKKINLSIIDLLPYLEKRRRVNKRKR